MLSPKFLPIGGIERIEVAAHIAEEHDAAGRRSHAADDRVVGLQAPFPDAGVGVGGVEPSRPGTVFLAEHVEWVEGRHSDPWLPDRYRPKLFDTLQRHRVAPFDLADHDEVRPGIVGRAVPFRTPHRARTKMDIGAGRKRYGDILDPGDRHAVQQTVGRKIKAIEVAIFRRDGHELLAAHGLNQDGWVGDVPVVPVLLHNLEMIFVVSSFGVEHDDRVGKGIVSLAHADDEIGGWIAAGDVEQPGFRVECVGRPGSATADREARRILPLRCVERRRAQRSADGVALVLGNQKELPDDLAGLRVEREHVALRAFEVAARVADEDEAVGGDRRRRNQLATFRVRDRRFPNSLAGFEVIGQHPPVLGAAKQHAIQVGGASVGRQKSGGIVLVGTPVHGASRRIEGENIEFGGADQSVIHHDQAGLEGGIFIDVVSAQNL